MANYAERNGITDPPKRGNEADDTVDDEDGELVRHSLRRASKSESGANWKYGIMGWHACD
jgi:hypothetical protein